MNHLYEEPRLTREEYLIVCAQIGNLGVVSKLISEGVDVNAQDKHGYTGLHTALYYNKLSVAELFLDYKGINPDIQNQQGSSALHFAVQLYEHSIKPTKRIISLLLKAEANVNIQDNQGRTPGHTAVLCRNVDALKILAESGQLNVHLKDHSGKSLLEVVQDNIGYGVAYFLLCHAKRDHALSMLVGTKSEESPISHAFSKSPLYDKKLWGFIFDFAAIPKKILHEPLAQPMLSSVAIPRAISPMIAHHLTKVGNFKVLSETKSSDSVVLKEKDEKLHLIKCGV